MGSSAPVDSVGAAPSAPSPRTARHRRTSTPPCAQGESVRQRKRGAKGASAERLLDRSTVTYGRFTRVPSCARACSRCGARLQELVQRSDARPLRPLLRAQEDRAEIRLEGGHPVRRAAQPNTPVPTGLVRPHFSPFPLRQVPTRQVRPHLGPVPFRAVPIRVVRSHLDEGGHPIGGTAQPNPASPGAGRCRRRCGQVPAQM